MNEKKYKVLIADDEYWTREKLKRMIPWEKYSLELLAPGVDGEDVLRRMEEEVPDILITDIDMPFCFNWASESWIRSWSRLTGNVWSEKYEICSSYGEKNGVLVL